MAERTPLANFFAPLGVFLVDVVEAVRLELSAAGFPMVPSTGRARVRRRPAVLVITVDRDADGDITWRATFQLDALGFVEHLDDDPPRGDET